MSELKTEVKTMTVASKLISNHDNPVNLLSWKPGGVRTAELDIIKHLLNKLDKKWHDHLPYVYFDRVCDIRELDMPWLKIPGIQDRSKSDEMFGRYIEREMHVIASRLCGILWHVDSPEVFYTAWLHCVKFNHQTSTLPFMSLDLLTPASPRHLLRHDLESLFYILIWGSCHYKFGEPDPNKRRKKTKYTPLDLWTSGGMLAVNDRKNSLMTHELKGDRWYQIQNAIAKEFAAINEKCIIPLYIMFSDAYTEKFAWREARKGRPYEDETMEGLVTYTNFLAEIGEGPEF
ncbi:hypothetical protein FA15DRAFT_659224 [Coprinopsis marcescibilis]|uniref:Fungal-type protein kinase domain-containing protein n=1 Tax=Coprinopsis marcescibilis TaxID=230819 RepID=A0A5C3KK28_COPMA|nr:hypothetical protein FA15DRAFT_659224 [Coprinopsis marcescibilis]